MSQKRAEELSKLLLANIATELTAVPYYPEIAGMLPLAIWKLTTINMGGDPGKLTQPHASDLDYDQLRDDMVACRSIHQQMYEVMDEITKGGPACELCEVARRAFPHDSQKADVLIWETDAFTDVDPADAYHLMALADQSTWVKPETEGISAVFSCADAVMLACKQKEMRMTGWSLQSELSIVALINPEIVITYIDSDDTTYVEHAIATLRAAGRSVLYFLFDNARAR